MTRPTRLHIPHGTLETGWWGPGSAEAPTLVLLHEGLGSVALWRDVPDRLAAATGCGVFAYSRFGYGNSDPASLPRPMTYMHDEAQSVLPAVLRAAEIRDAILIGHSDGGSIAAIYAGASAPHPETHLLGIVTIAAHFFVEDLNIASIRQIRAEYQSGTCATASPAITATLIWHFGAGTTHGWIRPFVRSTSPVSCPTSRCQHLRCKARMIPTAPKNSSVSLPHGPARRPTSG